MDAVMLQLTRARNRLTTPATLTLPEIAASGLTVSASGQERVPWEGRRGTQGSWKPQIVISLSSVYVYAQFSGIESLASFCVPQIYHPWSESVVPKPSGAGSYLRHLGSLEAPVYRMGAGIPRGGSWGLVSAQRSSCLPPCLPHSGCLPLPCPLTCWSMCISTSTSSASPCTSCTPCSPIPPR